MKVRWTPILGEFDFNPDSIVFHGRVTTWNDLSGKTHDDGAAPGIALCDAKFTGGTISATIRFANVNKSIAGIILASDPSNERYLVALLGTGDGHLVGLRAWDKTKWADQPQAGVGLAENRLPNHDYQFCVSMRGSEVRVQLDGVELIRTQVPGNFKPTPVGIWTWSQTDVVISKYEVSSTEPKAFVVMQYTAPYNELYAQVIKPICENEFHIKAHRSDETYGPGVIIADIERQINESRIVIAEITPTNANVYYEVGYAHALRKPTILIAENRTALPFDVSPFRVLMYENSIEGKGKVEMGLRNHLKAILSDPFAT